MSEDRIYNIYLKMKRRCSDPRDKAYKDYGGRGIYVCDEWKDKENGFMNFYNWAIENGYNENLCIDRIDNDGPYAPWNCRWVGYDIQSNNRRGVHKIELYGRLFTIRDLSNIYDKNFDSLYYQLITRQQNVYDLLGLPHTLINPIQIVNTLPNPINFINKK